MFYVVGWYSTTRELQYNGNGTINSLVPPVEALLFLRSNENRQQRQPLIQFPLQKQLLGYKLLRFLFSIQRYTSILQYTQPASHPYGVFEIQAGQHETYSP